MHLGPGTVETVADSASSSSRILLMGGARHKRNEEAAQALVASGGRWFSEVVGINVSGAVRAILESGLGADLCRWHDNLSVGELRQVYGSIGYFVHLGVEEGFGLPYIEALAAGATIIAINQPLTRTLLGEAAVLLEDGPTPHLAEQLTAIPEIPWDVRREVALRFSWKATTDAVEAAVAPLSSAASVDEITSAGLPPIDDL